MRVALLTEIPAPFRIPQWNALAAVDGIELRVLLLSERDPRRTYDPNEHEWRFDARVLRGRDVRVAGRWAVASRGVRRELEGFRPDAIVVGGWNQPAFLQAMRHARRRHVPLLVWVESTPRDERPRSRLLEQLKRRLVGAADGFLVPGQAAAEYVRGFGAPTERIAVAPNAVDAGFVSRVDAERRRRDELRRELGIRACCFLCVSRLSPEKGVDILVRAFAGVPGELVIAGGGPQEHELRRLAPAGVRLLGHVPRDALVRWYAAADAFVLPSRSETWGMALTEATAAGLPLIASDVAGAAYDLIEPGVNGLRVAAGDEGALREALRRLAADEPLRRRAAARSRELGRVFTPEDWATATAALVRSLAR